MYEPASVNQYMGAGSFIYSIHRLIFQAKFLFWLIGGDFLILR